MWLASTPLSYQRRLASRRKIIILDPGSCAVKLFPVNIFLLQRLAGMTILGFTLIELLIVILLVGILAAVLTPLVEPYKDDSLDTAAREIALALRFARNEAIRTEQLRGITIDEATEQITVFKVDTSQSFPIPGATLWNPHDKKPYSFNLTTHPYTQGVVIANTSAIFKFVGLSNPDDKLFFDTRGTPLLITASGVLPLEQAEILLAQGVKERKVTVQPVTGLVAIE